MLALKFISSKPANDTYSSIDWGYLVWGWITYNPYPIPDPTLPRRSTIYRGDDLNCTTATNKGPRYNWASAVNASHIGRIKGSAISQKTRWFCNSSWNWMRCGFHRNTIWAWVSHNRSSYIETHAECGKPTNFLDRWSHVQFFWVRRLTSVYLVSSTDATFVVILVTRDSDLAHSRYIGSQKAC